MRRMLLILVLALTTLTACGGGDTTVTAPPNATAVTSVEALPDPKLAAVISEWQKVAPEEMKANLVKPETLEEKIYTVPGTLTDVKTHYNALTSKGWYAVRKLTNTSNDQVLLLGYEHGVTALVVGAIDATKFGGSGVVIYTLKGNK